MRVKNIPVRSSCSGSHIARMVVGARRSSAAGSAGRRGAATTVMLIRRGHDGTGILRFAQARPVTKMVLHRHEIAVVEGNRSVLHTVIWSASRKAWRGAM